MPIRLQKDFPAIKVLSEENVFAISSERATHQDIRPLKILILNLMPEKQKTELQLLRLISQSPLQIDVDFLKTASHQHKNASSVHLNKFYLTFPDIQNERYDALIVTGAPVETLPFEEVDYWEELTQILDWGQSHTTSVLHICWGAQAGLYRYYQVDKTSYTEKLFGVFSQNVLAKSALLRGFSDVFNTPQSRYTGICEEQIRKEDLTIIAGDETIGATILESTDKKNIFILGHFEYDTETLKLEYERDLAKGLDTALPENYFVDDQAEGNIQNTWRSHAHLLFHNWINEVYQQTPYDIEQIGKLVSLQES